MKKVIQFSMRNAVALFLMMGLILAGGIYSLKEINIEKYPNVDIPYLTVVIPYPGASPEQVMREIGEPVERELMNVEGVKNIYTDAAANVLYSTMEIDMAVNMKDAEQLAKAAIDKIALPETASKPEFILQGPEPDPTIFAVGVYASEGSADVQNYVRKS